MMPDYDLKENLMSTLICMFDSGYTLPQGRSYKLFLSFKLWIRWNYRNGKRM